jgi:hypothetical protein
MSRKLLVYLTLLAVLLVAGCAKRNTAFENAEELSLISVVPVVGDPSDLDFDDTHLYVALDQGGLAAIDLQTYQMNWYPEMTSEDGTVTEFWRTRKLSVVPEFNRVFLNEIQFTDKVHIIDSSNPDSLQIFDSITGGTYDIQDLSSRKISDPTDANVIEVAFCANINISYGRYNGNIWLGTDYSTSAPALVAGVDLGEDYIYGAAQQRGLLVFEKETGRFISELAVGGEAQKLKVRDGYAYIASRQSGLQIVDIQDPENPLWVAEYPMTGYASGVDFTDDKVAVSSGSGGVYVLDVSTPAAPRLIQRITECGYANAVRFSGNKLVIASRDEGVLFYELN